MFEGGIDKFGKHAFISLVVQIKHTFEVTQLLAAATLYPT